MESKIDEYIEMFGEFPYFQICECASEKEVIDIIDRCLKAKKDVYELGILKEDLYY